MINSVLKHNCIKYAYICHIMIFKDDIIITSAFIEIHMKTSCKTSILVS